MLKHRVIAGLSLGAAFVLADFWLPPWCGWLVLLGISVLAQLEFYALANMAGIPVFRLVGVVCGCALISATFFTIGLDARHLAESYKWENVVLLTSLVAIFIRQFPQKYNDKPIPTIACTLVGMLYVPFLFNFITKLAFGWRTAASWCGETELTGRLLVFYLVAVVKCTDIGAFFVGMLLGKHKLMPRISPAKTWEGLIGGFTAGIISSWLFCRLFEFRLGLIEFGQTDAILLGFLLAVAGTLGDMFESLVKRASGAKDSGALFLGIGGILDVVDSLLFGAPVLYAYVHIFLQRLVLISPGS